jgi:PrtD family type I secretion system ABC transporter
VCTHDLRRHIKVFAVSKETPSAVYAELRPLFPALVSLFGFSFFNPIMYLATPIYAQQLFDRVSMSRNVTTLFVLASIATFLVIIYCVMDAIRGRALQRLGIAIDERLTRTVFEALHRESNSAGPLPASLPLSDINIVREFVSGPTIGSVFDALWSPIFIVVMFLVHPVYGLLSLLLISASIALACANHYISSSGTTAYLRAQASATELGTAIFRNSETVRALGMLRNLRDRWYGMHRAALGWQTAAINRTEFIAGLNRFLRVGQPIIIYTVGALLFLDDQIGLTGMIVGMMIMMRALTPIDFLITNWRVFQRFNEATHRLDRLIATNERTKMAVTLPRPTGTLAVNRIFGCAPGTDKIIINDVSFSLPQGRVLGIAGPSGAGKSCLCRLLVGVWRPRQGSIVFGDYDLSHWNPDDIGKHLGYMPQDIDVLPGTVGEYIARFDPALAADSKSLIEAASLAGVHDIIKSLPNGYATQIGTQGGAILSGGQRQRLALARAVYGNPAMIVLDEPSSNLDAGGEQALGAAIDRMRNNGSIVIVASHKLSLLAFCDDVLVLNGGAVHAFGSRAQIVERLPKLRPAPLLVVEGPASRRPG